MENNKVNAKKAVMIGCGFVGSASVFALMQSGLFTEIALIDADRNKAEGEAMDISHGIPFASPMRIYAGDYDDVADAGIVIISAGPDRNRWRQDWIWRTRMWLFSSLLSRRLQSGSSMESCLW